MSSVFRGRVEELLSINMAQGALFLYGLALTLQPQKALEPEGRCKAKMSEHYEAVVSFGFFLVFSSFASCVMGHYVKARVPGGGGLSLGPRRRKVMRVYAAVAWVLNVAASVLALVTFVYVLQAKLGAFACLPAATRFGVIVTYVVVGSVLAISYGDIGRALLMEAN